MEDFDCCAAVAERHQRPEDRVFDEPGDEFDGASAPDHRLNDEAIEARLGTGSRDVVEHRRRFLADPVGVAQIEKLRR